MDTDTIPVIAKLVLRNTIVCFDEDGTLLVETSRRGVRVVYASARPSRGAPDTTRLECWVDFHGGQMWVDDLRVASSLQSNGIGRQLVVAAEGIARALGLQTVNAFPLASAKHFWRKMGYVAHAKTATVLSKDLRKDRPPTVASHERTSMSRTI